MGSIITVRDEPTSTKLDLARIVSITDETVSVSCFSTRGSKLRKSRFYEVYTEGNKVFLGKPKRNNKAQPWTWQIQVEDVNELIPAQGLVMRKNGRLNAQSIKVVESILPKATVRSF